MKNKVHILDARSSQGPIKEPLSVCPSVRLSVCPSVCPYVSSAMAH